MVWYVMAISACVFSFGLGLLTGCLVGLLTGCLGRIASASDETTEGWTE